MKPVSASPFRHILLAFLTLALMSLPFAHRAGAAPMTPQMMQFIAMGGAFEDICGQSGSHVAGGCESCRIVGEMLLPLPAKFARPIPLPVPVFADLKAQSIGKLPKPHISPPVRAPPRA